MTPELKRSRIWLTLGMATVFGLCAAVDAEGQASVQWGCDATVGRTCYFSLQFGSGAARNFSLAAGRRTLISGVVPGRDQYMVSVDAPNYGDVNRCRELVSMGRLCQIKTVDPSYND